LEEHPYNSVHKQITCIFSSKFLPNICEILKGHVTKQQVSE